MNFENRFSGFPLADKPLKRLKVSSSQNTRLKQGVNEMPAKAEMSRAKLIIDMYLSFFDKK